MASRQQKNIDEMTSEAIEERMQQLQNEFRQLEELRTKKATEERREFVDGLVKQILERDYELNEILDELQQRTKKRRAQSQKPPLRDPENFDNTYGGRGPFKPWMLEQMRQRGYDPETKTDKRRYLDELKAAQPAGS